MERFPNSVRKFIRKEKARIRRQVFDLKEQGEKIKQLYEKLVRKPQTKSSNIKPISKPKVKKS